MPGASNSFKNAAGQEEIQTGESGAGHVTDRGVHPGEDPAFDRQWGGALAKPVNRTTTGQVGVAGPCVYYGCIVETALGSGAVTIRNSASAGTGDVVDILAASAGVGTKGGHNGVGIYCSAGVFANFASTGGVTFFYQQL